MLPSPRRSLFVVAVLVAFAPFVAGCGGKKKQKPPPAAESTEAGSAEPAEVPERQPHPIKEIEKAHGVEDTLDDRQRQLDEKLGEP